LTFIYLLPFYHMCANPSFGILQRQSGINECCAADFLAVFVVEPRKIAWRKRLILRSIADNLRDCGFRCFATFQFHYDKIAAIANADNVTSLRVRRPVLPRNPKN